MQNLIRFLVSALAVSTATAAFAADDLTGSTWEVRYADGDVTLYTFEANNRCTYTQKISQSGNQGNKYDNCRWHQNNDVLAFDANQHFRSSVAILSGSKLSGHYATNWNSSMGQFKGYRLED